MTALIPQPVDVLALKQELKEDVLSLIPRIDIPALTNNIMNLVNEKLPKWPIIDLMSPQPIENKVVLNIINDQLTSTTINNARTYVSSESFLSASALNQGDIVGVNNEGKIDKVSGCCFISNTIINQTHKTITVYYDDVINKTVNLCEINDGLLLLIDGLEPFILEENISQATASIIKMPPMFDDTINQNKAEYVIAYGKHGAADIIHLVKVLVIDNTITTTSKTTYKPSNIVEILDMSYECSGNLDILILGMYIPSISNFEAALFSIANGITFGYSANTFATIPIISSNKSLHTLTLPGQITIISYANSKCFILLPSNANGRFSAGNTVIDSDSIDCVDMIYDTTNGVILSLEKTISDNCYIQVLDVFGPEMKILKTKKLGIDIMIPISMAFDQLTNQFVIIYSDSMSSGQIKAKLFTNDGEQILIGSNYTATNITSANEPNIEHGRKLFAIDQNNFIAYITLDTGLMKCIFNDAYGVQPSSFLGIANKINNNTTEVILKGQIYTDKTESISSNFISKKVYYDNTSNLRFPNNLSLTGYLLVGTVLSKSKILVGM